MKNLPKVSLNPILFYNGDYPAYHTICLPHHVSSFNLSPFHGQVIVFPSIVVLQHSPAITDWELQLQSRLSLPPTFRRPYRQLYSQTQHFLLYTLP